MNDYRTPKRENWDGRKDQGENAKRWHDVVRITRLTEAKKQAAKTYALLGFCSDEGIRRNAGRVGASEGPAALRAVLKNLPCHFAATTTLLDVGDVICAGRDLEAAGQDLSKAVLQILCAGIFPIVLGGGHEMAFGHGRGAHEFLQHSAPRKKLGIINVDAHFDLRPLENGLGTSGTSFTQLHDLISKSGHEFHFLCVGVQEACNTQELFERAQKMRVTYILREDLLNPRQQDVQHILDSFLKQVDAIYLSVCLDVFAQHLAPGVSAPSPYGLSLYEFFPLLQKILLSGKVLSFDVAELSPPLDRDNQTARLAARIIFEVLQGHS